MSCIPEKQSFLNAYDAEAVVVKEEHPDWSASQQRKAIASFLRPKFQMDMAAAARESRGETEYQVSEAEFTLTETGDIFYTKYGRTLEELNERTKQLYPDMYSQTDHATSNLIQEAFRQGATNVVTGYFRAGDDHRDIIVMQLDPDTKIGTTNIISTVRNEGHQSFESLKLKAQQSFSFLNTVTPDARVFVLSDVPIEPIKAHSVVDSVLSPISIGKKYADLQVATHVLDTFQYAGIRTYEELRGTADQIRAYRMKKKEERMHVSKEQKQQPRLPGFLTVWMPPLGRIKQEKIVQNQIMPVPAGISPLKESVTQKTQEKKSIQVSHATMQKDKRDTVLFFRRKTGEEKTKQQPVSDGVPVRTGNREYRDNGTVRSQERRHIPKKEKSRVPSAHAMVPKKEREIRLRPVKERKRMEKTVGRQTVPYTKEKKMSNPFYELVFLTRQIKEKIIRIGIRQKQENKLTPKQRKELQLHKTVMQITYTILLWKIFEDIKKMDVIPRKKREAVRHTATGNKEHRHDEVEHPWILLSIIRYLAMLREQGLYKPMQKKQKKHKNHMWTSHIIYTHAFPYDHQSHSFFVI